MANNPPWSADSQNWEITDKAGRRLTLRRLTALDKLRLFKAAGPELAENHQWLGLAMLAIAVTSIDDVPVPVPQNENQIEAMVGRLGDDGIAAVADTLLPLSSATTEELVANAGN